MSHQNYCLACSKLLKKNEQLFYVAATRRGADKIEALHVCGQCAPHFEKIVYLYEFSGGATYTSEDIPSRWNTYQTIVHYKKTLMSYADRTFVLNPENRSRVNQELVDQIIAESAIDTNQLPPFTDFPFLDPLKMF